MPANLIRALPLIRQRSLEGAAKGVDAELPTLTDALRASAPHGNDTGATQASYNVRRVGMGETGNAAFQAGQAAVENANPGHAASSTVRIDAPLGAIADSGTDYQIYLETERAGEFATLGPFVPLMGRALTRAAADGSRRALES